MTEENKGLVCPITGCPIKHVLIATVVAMAVTYGFDFVYHGMVLKPDYEATKALWRPEAEMMSMMNICIVYHLVLAFGVSALYCLFSKNSACGGACSKTGIKFGLLLGLIVGIIHFSSYIWLPMPMDLAIKWLGGSLAWGVLVGYALSIVASKCCACKK